MADPTSGAPSRGKDPWLTVPQVADELSIHPATVRVWINSGRLAAVRAGRTWRVRRSDLDRALLLDASPAASQDASSALPEAQLEAPSPLAPRQIAPRMLAPSR